MLINLKALGPLYDAAKAVLLRAELGAHVAVVPLDVYRGLQAAVALAEKGGRHGR